MAERGSSSIVIATIFFSSLMGCGSEETANGAGTSSGGSAGSTGGATSTGGVGGASTGGSTSTGGTGAVGASGGSTSAAFCPPGSDELVLDLAGASPERVDGVPPDPPRGQNIEGPLWLDGSLYLSEITFGGGIDPARILEHVPGVGTTVLLESVAGGEPGEDAGTNGLALDGEGNVLAARHWDGSISIVDLDDPSIITPIVTTYMGARFNSPNDIAVHSNGGLYFTDPSYQGPSPSPQAEERAYRVPSGGEPEPIDGAPDRPNGITLGHDERTLFILGSSGLVRFPVDAGGGVGNGTSMTTEGGDGMGKDCAGNLYITEGSRVRVFDRDFVEVTPAIDVPITGGQVTNVAFGGPDRTTLYITSLLPPSLFRVELNVPGYPY